ncbi:tRNA(Glu)-specific nuclease WapA [Thermoflexales bacterium]|nr:tRNA(Glu)-specific nuclease WapA [Thermoflexales bacterium]
MIAAQGTRSSALRFTGEQTDDDTGLVYLRARWYDSATGRFTTRDPFPGFVALPQTLHPYTYVGNNPVNLTDPSGKFAFLPLLAAAVLGGILGGVSYYTIQTILNADPCLGVQWHWREALFWGGAGGGLGGLLGTGIYAGWWIGVKLGWWVTVTGGAGGAVILHLRNLSDLAQKVANDLGGILRAAQGDGWRITLPQAAQGGRDIIIRIMESGGIRSDAYFRIAVAGKAAITAAGQFSNDPLLTHHPIDLSDLQSAFETIRQLILLIK